MYSLISILTRFFSSSKSDCASAFASSVLPTPVGPRKRKEPTGLSGSLIPALERSIASDTLVTASSCPITLSWSIPSILRSFSLSPCISLVIGIPVQRPTILDISSSPTWSRRRLLEELLLSSASFSCFSSSALRLGSLPYLSSAALLRSYSLSAFSMREFTSPISSRSF